MEYKNRFVELYLLRSLVLRTPLQITHTASLTTNMAYNRDWDRGKDSWNSTYYDNYDDSSWNDGGGRENIRPRDEDYHSEGKRRKYNDGVCHIRTGWCIFESKLATGPRCLTTLRRRRLWQRRAFSGSPQR